MTLPTESSEPFFLATTDPRLFAVYHPAAAPGPARAAIVLCAPWGPEYVRAHRALRQLALRLARHGCGVLRFDYAGCGDSEGDDEQVGLDQWRRDVDAAIAEARRRSGARRVFLIGLRLGASLAWLAASHRDDIGGLVLWEPVLSGPDYLAELADLQRQTLSRYAHRPDAAAADGTPTERLGFPISPTLAADLAALELNVAGRPPTKDILMVGTEPTPAWAALAQALTTARARVQIERVVEPRIWTEDPDKALVPQRTLEAIVNWLAEGIE